jgi:uncharacterized protein YndB with AHSA1/START domain
MGNDIIASVNSIIHAPIDRVWRALTDPQDIARYMMGAQVISDWKAGSTITWKGEWNGKPFEDTGRVLAIMHPDLLKYSHSSTTPEGEREEHVITIELKEVAGATHVRLTQGQNATQEASDHAVEMWTTMLDGLKKVLGEAPVASPEVART